MPQVCQENKEISVGVCWVHSKNRKIVIIVNRNLFGGEIFLGQPVKTVP